MKDLLAINGTPIAHAGIIAGENLTAAKASGGMQINPTNLSARYIWHTWTSHGVSQHHSQSWLWHTLLFRFRAKVRRIGGHKYSSLALFYLPYSDAIPPVIARSSKTEDPTSCAKQFNCTDVKHQHSHKESGRRDPQVCTIRLADLLGKNFHDPATKPANVRVLEYQHLQCMVESATYIILYPCEAWWSWFLERCSSAVNWKFVWASRKQGQQRIGRSSH